MQNARSDRLRMKLSSVVGCSPTVLVSSRLLDRGQAFPAMEHEQLGTGKSPALRRGLTLCESLEDLIRFHAGH